MKLCGQCKNREKKSRCKYYTEISNYAEKCKDFEEKKQKTNADRIRSMSDEELANFLSEVKADGIYYEEGMGYPIISEVWKEWLQSEVEE